MQLSRNTCSHSGNQSQTLIFARTDCAENILLNTTWIPILLDYTSDDHRMVGPLTILSVFISVSLHFTAVANLSVFGSSASNLISYPASCKDSIEVPVRQSALEQIINNLTVTQLQGGLNQGFGLEWKHKKTRKFSRREKKTN